MIVKTGRSETCRVGGSLENSGKVCVAGFPLEILRGRVPIPGRSSIFSLKTSNSMDKIHPCYER